MVRVRGRNPIQPTGTNVSVDWTDFGSQSLTVRTSTPCAAADSFSSSLAVTVTNSIIPDAVTGLYPGTDTLIEAFPFAISWKPSANAQFYDFYVWPDGTINRRSLR